MAYSSPSFSTEGALGAGSTSALPLSTILFLSDNASAAGKFTNIQATPGIGGTTANALASTVTQTDDSAWGRIMRTTSDAHVVALSNNSNTYVHQRYNGASWANGDTIGNLTYGTTGNISLVTDGTSVWALTIDSSSNIQYNKWMSGTGWGGWTVLEATRTNTPSYITTCYSSAAGGIMVAWTEHNGSNYDIIGSFLSTSVAIPTATAAITLGADTFTGSSSFTAPASAAIAMGADAFAGSASFAASASSAITLGADVFSGSAAFTAAASAAITLGADTFAGSAAFTSTASAGITLGSDAFSGLGLGSSTLDVMTAFQVWFQENAMFTLTDPGADAITAFETYFNDN